jgi:hypothetical protein
MSQAFDLTQSTQPQSLSMQLQALKTVSPPQLSLQCALLGSCYPSCRLRFLIGYCNLRASPTSQCHDAVRSLIFGDRCCELGGRARVSSLDCGTGDLLYASYDYAAAACLSKQHSIRRLRLYRSSAAGSCASPRIVSGKHSQAARTGSSQDVWNTIIFPFDAHKAKRSEPGRKSLVVDYGSVPVTNAVGRRTVEARRSSAGSPRVNRGPRQLG